MTAWEPVRPDWVNLRCARASFAAWAKKYYHATLWDAFRAGREWQRCKDRRMSSPPTERGEGHD